MFIQTKCHSYSSFQILHMASVKSHSYALWIYSSLRSVRKKFKRAGNKQMKLPLKLFIYYQKLLSKTAIPYIQEAGILYENKFRAIDYHSWQLIFFQSTEYFINRGSSTLYYQVINKIIELELARQSDSLSLMAVRVIILTTCLWPWCTFSCCSL